MDIKSKKYNQNSKITIIKNILVFLFITGIIVFYSSGIWIIKNAVIWSTTPFFQEDYKETYSFREQFDTLLYYAVETNLIYKSQGNIEDGKAINEDELIRSFKKYYNVVDGIITGNTKIINDKLILVGNIPEYLYENYKEYEYLVNNRLSTYRKIYIQNQLDKYNEQIKTIEQYNNFYYCIEDENGNVIYGNSDKEKILSFTTHFIQQGDFITDKMGNSFSDFYSKNISAKDYKLYAGVPDKFEPNDKFFIENDIFNKVKQRIPSFFISLFSSLTFCLIIALYLIRMAGQLELHGNILLRPIDKIYNDIHFWLTIISEICLIYIINKLSYTIYYEQNKIILYISIIIQCICFVSVSIIALNFLCCMSRQIKSKLFIKNTIIVTIVTKIGNFFSNKSFKGWILFTILIYNLINIFLIFLLLILMSIRNKIFFIICLISLIIFNVICLIILLNSLDSISLIMNTVSKISMGNFSEVIDIKKISPSFVTLANDIINIQKGLKYAVEEAVKGERMKTELITNVSHDLKTPLTSIITYIDLLKNENLNNNIADGYIDILNEKALRLKQLIEDLIEASKASSGNLKVTKQKIDLRQLVMMASGEFEEKMEKVGILFKINSTDETIICADGNHMWRIIENLISNAIKYSMKNSRIYVDIFKTESSGIFIIKNISEFQIEINPEMLTERFVRGDESRTTEGSGLGLSIAKSLTILQNGEFNISIDGDLFKVTIKMPLWNDDNN